MTEQSNGRLDGINTMLAESSHDGNGDGPEPDFVNGLEIQPPACTTLRPSEALSRRRDNSTLDPAPMPFCPDLERWLIGAMLTNPGVADDVGAILRVDDLEDSANRIIISKMSAMRAQGITLDPKLLLPRLPADGEPAEGWGRRLIDCMADRPLAANAAHYAHEIRDAAQRRRLIAACQETARLARLGTVPETAIAEQAAALEQVRVGTTAAGNVLTYRALTCAELDAAEYATEYLLEWMLVAGQPCVVAGPKKALKTSLLLALCFALATGRHFLGVFRVPRAVRVCMMTGESGLATIQETLRRIAQAEGFNLADVDNLIISDQLPVFGHIEHTDALKAFLTGHQTELLIVDPAYLCLPTDGNEGSLFAMGQLLKSISDLCQSLGVTLVLIHHTRKNVADPLACPELEDISWAGFQEFARQWFLIGRREKYQPGSGRHALWLNVGGSAGHNSAWAIDVSEGCFNGTNPRHWEVTVSKADEARRTAQEKQEDAKQQRRAETRHIQIESDKRAIIEAIGKTPNGDTKTGIRNRSVPQSSRFNVALSELLNESSVITVTITKDNGIPYEGFRLKRDNESEQQDASGHRIRTVPSRCSRA